MPRAEAAGLRAEAHPGERPLRPLGAPDPDTAEVLREEALVRRARAGHGLAVHQQAAVAQLDDLG